ncbi:MAG: hypothetical protein M1816_002000 [Peltula sp. TS41687]|nr:MAG: hypothetical protein M1816_002000 [Peltula sp. TS41687]
MAQDLTSSRMKAPTIDEVKRYFRFRVKMGRVYSSLRSDMKQFMETHNVQSKSKAGIDKWDETIDFACGHKALESAQKHFKAEPEKARGYLSVLLADVAKKRTVTRAKTNLQLAQAAQEKVTLGCISVTET